MLWEETGYLCLQTAQQQMGKCVVYPDPESQKWKGQKPAEGWNTSAAFSFYLKRRKGEGENLACG